MEKKIGTFISVGNAVQKFPRFWDIIHENLDLLPRPIVAQMGQEVNNIHMSFDEYFNYCDRNNFELYVKNTSVFITHAGVGNILLANSFKLKPYVIPRLSRNYEHVDDHQVELVDKIKEMGLVIQIDSINDLQKGLMANIHLLATKKIVIQRPNLIQGVDNYLIAAAIGGHLSEAIQFIGDKDNLLNYRIVTCAYRANEPNLSIDVFPDCHRSYLVPIRITQAIIYLWKRPEIKVIFTTGTAIGFVFVLAGALLGRRGVAVETLTRIKNHAKWFKLVSLIPRTVLYQYSWCEAKLFFPRKILNIDVRLE